MNTSDPIVVEKFKSLPQNLKDVLFSENTTDIIFSIGKENGLTVFQMEELADEIGLVILGIVTQENFSKNIEKRLLVSTKKIEPITRAINEKIFNPILGDLKVLEKKSMPFELPTTSGDATQQTKVAEIPKAPPIAQPLEPKKIVIQKSIEQPKTIQSVPPPAAPKPIEPAVVQIPKPAETQKQIVNKLLEVLSKPKETAQPQKPQEPLPIHPVPVPQAPILTQKKQNESLNKSTVDIKQIKSIPTQIAKPSTEPQVFAKPIPDPYREPLNVDVAPSPKQRIANWEDVLKNIKKEPESHPEAKIALEKAMSDTTVPASIIDEKNIASQKQNIVLPPKYEGGKDPYREPLE